MNITNDQTSNINGQNFLQQLQARTQTIYDASEKALQWITDNPKAIKGDAGIPQLALRRFRRQAKRLNQAAQQPPAVAVFGASQSGKSYLVSSLATQPKKELIAHYQGKEMNFLTEMNPQGGNESTGLVSRFTTRPVQPPQASMPVPLRLLSAADIVKILTNTSIEDFKVKDAAMQIEQIESLFASVETVNQSNNIHKNSFMDIDAIEDLCEYLQIHYPDHHRFEVLGEAYWRRVIKIIAFLTPDQCANILSPLWNGLSQFTDLARSLFAILYSLGKPDIAFCSTEALAPRERSILNVETLFILGKPAGDMISLSTADGKINQFERSLVTALTAEITIPIGEAPWPFLKETDLLDFPGARSREMIYDPQAFLEAPESLGRLFLRGKVAYLFQRYEVNHEITAMLLCIGDSIQNVSTLPGMIDNWVKNSIGITPEERLNQRDSLFVVLTKFDREFEQKQGDLPSSGSRWTARIDASLVDFFKTSSWVDEWHPGQPFNNVYWLRSPAIRFPAVMDYEEVDGIKQEKGISQHSQQLVATMEHAYLTNGKIQRYVKNPQQAWNEVLKPNDGGISYLAEELAPICDSRLKPEQISTQVESLAANLARFLRPYYRSGNIEESIRQASEEAQNIARSLMRCVAAQMFGPLLHALQVTRDHMMEAWHVLETQTSEQPVIIGRTSDVDSLFEEMFPEAESKPTDNHIEEKAARDRHEQYADLVLAKWNSVMDAFARHENTLESFKVPSEQMTALISEIARLSRRLNLRDFLADKFRKNASTPGIALLGGETQALIAEIELGNFVTFLGYQNVPLDKRPMTRGLKGEYIFTPRNEPVGLLELPEQPTPYNERFIRDWISALVRRFEENAGAPDLDGIDPAANESLGHIISTIEKR